MSHDFHDGQPGYSPAQILHDGCQECRDRGRYPWQAILRLDPLRFAYAWHRAAQFERGELADVCATEVPVLRVLWAVQIRLEERGFPIGVLPDARDVQEVMLP